MKRKQKNKPLLPG